jgi:hypothetical protein
MQYNVKRTAKHRKRIELFRKIQCNMRKNLPHILPTNSRRLIPLEKYSNKLRLNG